MTTSPPVESAPRDSAVAGVAGARPRFARPTPVDLAFSLGVGGLLVLSPLTGSSRLWSSLLLGAVGGAVTLAVRMRRRSAGTLVTSHGATLARPSLPVLALLAGVALVFAPTLVWLYREYTENVWHNGHGLFVPLLMALLARSALRRDASRGEQSSAWGFAFLVPALLLLVADAGIRSRYLSAFALVVALPGLGLLLLGAERTRRLVLPLALALFLVPLPTWLEDLVGLSAGSAALAREVLAWLDAPVIWHQTQLRLPHEIITIGQNCSGFAALYAGYAFGALLLATSRSRLRGWLLLLAVYPIVLVANGMRCVVLALLSLRYGLSVIDTAIHGLSGIGVFVIVLGFLWLFADRQALREALS
jgi:exosortase